MNSSDTHHVVGVYLNDWVSITFRAGNKDVYCVLSVQEKFNAFSTSFNYYDKWTYTYISITTYAIEKQVNFFNASESMHFLSIFLFNLKNN